VERTPWFTVPGLADPMHATFFVKRFAKKRGKKEKLIDKAPEKPSNG
jgi:hypothetical protein